MSKGKYLELLGKVVHLAKQTHRPPARVLVVSKTRTPEEIMNIYEEGCRDFGENYVDELLEKCTKVRQPWCSQLPSDIRWHFIGHLQSNKIKKVLVHNLQLLETIDRIGLAEKLNKELEKSQRQLDVLVQVQTSSQDSTNELDLAKHGCKPNQVLELARYVQEDCRWLKYHLNPKEASRG